MTVRLSDIDLSLRMATLDDAQIIHSWREIKEARRYYRSTAKTSLSDHIDWFEIALEDDSRVMMMIVEGDRAVGHIRLDCPDKGSKEAEISIVVDPDAYGRGIGKRSIDLALRFASQSGIASVIAEVHRQNTVSSRLFERCGFTKIAQDGDFLRYKFAITGKNISAR